MQGAVAPHRTLPQAARRMLSQAVRPPSGGAESEEPCLQRTEPFRELTCPTSSQTHATRARGRESSQCGPARCGVAILVRKLGAWLAKTAGGGRRRRAGGGAPVAAGVPRSHSARWRCRLAAHGKKRAGGSVRGGILSGRPEGRTNLRRTGGRARRNVPQRCWTSPFQRLRAWGGGRGEEEDATTQSPPHAVMSVPGARWTP